MKVHWKNNVFVRYWTTFNFFAINAIDPKCFPEFCSRMYYLLLQLLPVRNIKKKKEVAVTVWTGDKPTGSGRTTCRP